MSNPTTIDLVAALDPELLYAVRLELTAGPDALDALADEYAAAHNPTTVVTLPVRSPASSWRSAA